MIINYTIALTLIGVTLLGITAGLLGVFVVLRQQSLLGDAIAHASLPGMALAFLITYSKNPFILMMGGALAGGVAALLLHIIIHKTPLKKDAALGIILSVFFGIGLVLITVIQKVPIASQSILNKFLFGNVSTLLKSDVYAMCIISVLVIAAVILFWKEFVMVTFDQSYAHAMGYRVVWLDALLTGLIVLTIMIGLQTVGVILMSSLLIAPAAAARQWTVRILPMAAFAIFFAVSASVLGALISSHVRQLPTGPTIVVLLSVYVFVSLACAFKRVIMV
ncbi:MAG TPA: metal ABC transporter permease [Candidatus Dependentiae bacterium]|nr:metal ABC transporter permease [Candidatus Dependentiae bacterium]HRQ62827.1 metal ABC transporter permease [Candidatus Dependentiae bacterium]